MVKIIGIAFVGIICFKLIKDIKAEIAPLILIAVGAVILLFISDYATETVSTLLHLSEQAGLSKTVFSSLIKIVGIGYLTEYSVNVCNDMDCSSLGKKIEIGGKLTIFSMALPIINEVIKIIGDFL